MKFFRCLYVTGIVMALAACGGGGGGGGGANTDGVTQGPGTTTPVAVASMTMDVLSGAGTSTVSISAIEISKVAITLKNAAGSPVPGVVVTFSETGAGLLTIAPVSKTALTDLSGVASVEIRAATGSSVGATTVSASATVDKVVVTAEKAIAITSAPTGGSVDPLALANALNFLDVNPADKSIVLAGAGGNGRSESATLRFRVVDKNNTPVKGATVTFAAVPASDVTLNIVSSTSDADGVVVTTVSSKSVATAVVIKATVTRVDTSTINSQSDQLLVTTGVATLAGFDMSATKYNLNFGITGDTTTITARIVDANGNPVADGVPVMFTAPFGAVGTSSRGGCVTVSGGCSVDYSVQNPRPNDGQRATVTASTQVGDGSSIGGTLTFNFVDANLLDLFASSRGTGGATFAFGSSCAIRTFSVFAGTPASFPAPASTTIAVTPITSGLTANLKSGSPIADQITSPPQRTPVDFEVDVSAIAGLDQCVAGGATTAAATFDVKFKAGSIETTRRISVTYPRS